VNTQLAGWVAYALTAQTFSWSGDDVDVCALLADAGWTPQRIHDHARQTLTDEQPWPHAVNADVVAGLGAARFLAALGQARQTLGVWTLEVEPPTRRTALDADERRLMAEVPPHHVA